MGGGQGQNITHALFMTDLVCTVLKYTSEQVQCLIAKINKKFNSSIQQCRKVKCTNWQSDSQNKG